MHNLDETRDEKMEKTQVNFSHRSSETKTFICSFLESFCPLLLDFCCHYFATLRNHLCKNFLTAKQKFYFILVSCVLLHFYYYLFWKFRTFFVYYCNFLVNQPKKISLLIFKFKKTIIQNQISKSINSVNHTQSNEQMLGVF